MKIYVVSAMFPPIRTGTSHYALNISYALKSRGNEVGVVALENRSDKDPENQGRELILCRLAAIRFPFKNFFNHFSVTSLFPWNYFRLYKLCQPSPPDVIFVVNHYLDIIFPAIVVSRLLHIPLVCSVGTQLQSANSKRNRLLNYLDRLICGQLIFPFCNKVIAWDKEIYRYLSDIHGNRVTLKTEIVNFGVNGDADSLFLHAHDYRSSVQILGVGAVTEQRNFLPLIYAFNIISAEFPHIKLKIIGHIYYQGTTELIDSLGLSSKIEMVGEQPHKVVLREMKDSALYFVSLSGKYLGLGTATIEAMLLGLPVVANVPKDLLGTVELRDGKEIMLVDSLEPTVIATAIKKLLSREDLRKQVGEGAKAFVQTNLNWAKVAKDMEAAILPLIH